MKIDPTLYKGRPADTRIPKEERCYELLDRLGVEYCRADHEHADTIEQCHEIEKLLGAEICKNLLLTNRQMTDIYLPHAGRQAVQDEDTFKADRHGAAVLLQKPGADARLP